MWQRLKDAFRALRRHAQPCATCRDQVREIDAWATDWDARFTDLLGKLRAQYARTAKREKAMLDRLEAQVAEDLEESHQPNGGEPEDEMAQWRALARSRGFPV